MRVRLYYLFTIIVLTATEKIRNYYQGLEIPRISKFHDSKLGAKPKAQLFTQKLNHFDPTDETTWSQKYWENNIHYKKGGPVFLMISGEAPASPIWMTSGTWLKYGENLNVMYFLVEHRYYGSSRPTNNTSTDNLKFLNSQQALADLAYFIQGMNEKHNLTESTKWIVYGGSYAGSLAAWLRMKYPHLVYGAVSSSSPLLAKINFHEYFEVVHHSLAAYTNACEMEIAKATKQLRILLKTKRGRLFVTEWFNLCEEISDKEEDISFFFSNIAYNLANVVQYDKGYKHGQKLTTIRGVCNFIVNGTHGHEHSAVRRYAEVNNLLLGTNTDDCLSTNYKAYIKKLRETDWDTSSTYGKQWLYQTCTEFGFFQTSVLENDTFGPHLPLDLYIKQCKDVFGLKFSENIINGGINRTNIEFGGLNISTDRIIYSHGSVDPWYPLGFHNSSDSKFRETVFIKGTSHCSDFIEPSDKDSADLKNARRRISNIIHSWISQK